MNKTPPVLLGTAGALNATKTHEIGSTHAEKTSLFSAYHEIYISNEQSETKETKENIDIKTTDLYDNSSFTYWNLSGPDNSTKTSSK